MDDYGSLNHTKWECKYHIVFIPKCRRKIDFTRKLRKHLGGVFRQFAVQKESKILEGHLGSGSRPHVDVDSTKVCGGPGRGLYQGQEAIHIARTVGAGNGTSREQHFWARGLLCVNVGRDEKSIREYIQRQKRRSPTRPDEDVRLTAAVGGSQQSALSGFTYQASGSAGGY